MLHWSIIVGSKYSFNLNVRIVSSLEFGASWQTLDFPSTHRETFFGEVLVLIIRKLSDPVGCKLIVVFSEKAVNVIILLHHQNLSNSGIADYLIFKGGKGFQNFPNTGLG